MQVSKIISKDSNEVIDVTWDDNVTKHYSSHELKCVDISELTSKEKDKLLENLIEKIQELEYKVECLREG